MEQIQRLHDLQYWSNAQMCIDLLQKWFKIKPDNEETKEMIKAMQEMTFYVARLKDDSNKKDKLLIEYKTERNKWCLKAGEFERKFENASKDVLGF
jgi:hypothetical protein|tara:strand:+ start:1191 stop:1478 length:288 start_codon:yes stop_codon:yes gene_type:complete